MYLHLFAVSIDEVMGLDTSYGMNAQRPLTLAAVPSVALVLLWGCSGAASLTQQTADGGESVDAAGPSDSATVDAATLDMDAADAAPSEVGDADAGTADAETHAPCVKPVLPHGFFCAAPGGTNSTGFDPVSCNVTLDGGASTVDSGGPTSCVAQCAAWFNFGSTDGVFCVAANLSYIDAGPPGWLACDCNIP